VRDVIVIMERDGYDGCGQLQADIILVDHVAC